MKKSFIVFMLLLFSGNFLAQNSNLFIPRNIKTAYDKGTRNDSGTPGDNYWQNSVDYKIHVEVVPQEYLVKGSEVIMYKNNSPEKLKELVLRLYPDYYRKGNARDQEIEPDAVTDGMRITKLSINGEPIDLDPAKRSVLRRGTNFGIRLKTALEPNTATIIEVEWNYLLPTKSFRRTGAFDANSSFIAYWYPQISVYDDIDGWDGINYKGVVEFYNEYGNFDVQITTPEKFGVWATGILQNPENVYSKEILERFNQAKSSEKVLNIIKKEDLEKGNVTKTGTLTWHYKAEHISDFAFAMGSEFLWDASTLKLKNGKEVFISSVYDKNTKYCEEVTDVARKSIDYFSNELPGVPFPYPTMTIFNFPGEGGMEYPMMANDGILQSRKDMVKVTVHEIAHSYFPFYVGTNEKKYAWMDEGWATFFMLDICDMIESTSKFHERLGRDLSVALGNENELPPMIPTYIMTGDQNAVTIASYFRPALALELLKNMLGMELFTKCLREYMSRWNGKHPMPYDFFFTFNQVAGENLDWFWNSWFFERGYVDLAIKNVSGKKITVEKKGILPVPIALTITYIDNTTETISKPMSVWKTGNTEFDVMVNSSKEIKNVELGNTTIPDTNPKDNKFELIKDVSLVNSHLEDYAGTYKIGETYMAILTVENGKLFGASEGEPKDEITYIKDDEFEIQRVSANIKFLRDPSGKVIKFVVVQQNGREMTADKIK